MEQEPITEEYLEQMGAVAAAIDRMFNDDPTNPTVAFAVLIAEFGDIKDGRVNFISNANREDMVAMMAEYIARQKGHTN